MPILGSPMKQATSSGVLSSTSTIGDGTAEDIMIKLDGNALDYHIGLDDSTDKLTIGKGATLGTTTSMTFDSDGIILEPLQPAFSTAIEGSGITNHSVWNGTGSVDDNTVTTPFDTELYDVNADFDNSNYIFTAPVTGMYALSAAVRIDNVDASIGANGYIQPEIKTTNARYFMGPHAVNTMTLGTDVDFLQFEIHVIDQMDAGDTAFVRSLQYLGTAQADIGGDTSSGRNTWFCGRLIA